MKTEETKGISSNVRKHAQEITFFRPEETAIDRAIKVSTLVVFGTMAVGIVSALFRR